MYQLARSPNELKAATLIMEGELTRANFSLTKGQAGELSWATTAGLSFIELARAGCLVRVASWGGGWKWN